MVAIKKKQEETRARAAEKLQEQTKQEAKEILEKEEAEYTREIKVCSASGRRGYVAHHTWTLHPNASLPALHRVVHVAPALGAADQLMAPSATWTRSHHKARPFASPGLGISHIQHLKIPCSAYPPQRAPPDRGMQSVSLLCSSAAVPPPRCPRCAR